MLFWGMFSILQVLKGALRSFGEEDQTQNINIYNVNVVIIQFIYSVTE